MSRNTPQSTTARLRRAIRQTAQQQLDALLLGPTVMPDGTTGTVLDDILVRSLAGYGFQVAIEVRHPNEAGRVDEDPSVTKQAEQPKPLIEVAQ